MLDRYHTERLGTRYKDKSTTEIETSSHGSEVCNCRIQRFFFSLRITIAASPLTIAASLPSGTQGISKAEQMLPVNLEKVLNTLQYICMSHVLTLGQI